MNNINKYQLREKLFEFSLGVLETYSMVSNLSDLFGTSVEYRIDEETVAHVWFNKNEGGGLKNITRTIYKLSSDSVVWLKQLEPDAEKVVAYVGDYVKTNNWYLHIDKYPFPKPSDSNLVNNAREKKSREKIESLHEELQSKVDDENLSREERESAYEELQAYVDDIDDDKEHLLAQDLTVKKIRYFTTSRGQGFEAKTQYGSIWNDGDGGATYFTHDGKENAKYSNIHEHDLDDVVNRHEGVTSELIDKIKASFTGGK